jgi:WD40 repeat protein
MQILKGHLSIKPVRSLAFSPDSARLASSARDYKTFLWDLSTGKYEVIEDKRSYTVGFSPDGKKLATGQGWGLSECNLETGAKRTLDISSDYGHGIDVGYSPDGRLLAAVSGSVRLFDAASLEPVSMGPGHLRSDNCLAFSRDGKTLATAHADRSGMPGQLRTDDRLIRLWDVASRSERSVLRGHSAAAEALSFSPNGRHLAVATGQRFLVWEVSTGEVVADHKAGLRCKDIAFSPDGRFLAFANNDATVRFFDTATWREAAAFDWKVGPIISLAIAPDGMRAAAGSGKGKIVVWDVDL